MQKKPYRRKRYFTGKKFQLKYIGLILAAAFLSAIVSGYTIYYNSWMLLGEKLASVYPQGRLVEILRSVNIKLAINVLIISILCAGIGVIASHRIAGPVYRIIQFLDNVTAGNYSQRLTLRRKDELRDLADAVNRLVDKLEKKS